MKRKQEVIAVIAKEILEAYGLGLKHVEPLEKLRAENLYLRIAPLLVREFPEEGIRALKRVEMFLDGINFSDPPGKPRLCRYCPTTKYDSKVGISHYNSCLIVDLRNAIVLIENAKRLWEGQASREFPAERFRELRLDGHLWSIEGWMRRARAIWEGDHIAGVRKKVCQTCGEEKRIVRDVEGFPESAKVIDCPDCGGIGSVIPDEPGGFLDDRPQGVYEGIYTDSEGHLKKTRRINKERRVIRCGLRDYDVKCRANGIIPTAIHGADLDRRRFPDRRKAASGEAQD